MLVLELLQPLLGNVITLTSNGSDFAVATSNGVSAGALDFSAAGPTLVQAASQSLPDGMTQNYNEVSQITSYIFSAGSVEGNI